MRAMIGLESKKIQWGWGLALALLALAIPSTSGTKEFNPNNPLNPPPPIYWCPNRGPDQLIATVPEPGCVPLVEKEDEKNEKAAGREKQTAPKEPIKIVEIQNEASKFVQQYRKFLDCCANDVGSLEDLEDLREQANYILKSVEQKGIYNSTGFATGTGGVPGPGDGSVAGSGGLGGVVVGGNEVPGTRPKLGTIARQWTISEIVGAVARARDDLRKLKVRLEQLGESMDKVDTLGYEAAGKERIRIEQEKESIAKEFRAKRPPESARTGMEIQDSNLPVRIGGDIEDTTLNMNFGADIGYTVSPYSTVQESIKPRRGTQIQDTNLPNRIGPATQDTNLPYSFGFEIEKKENPEGSSTTPSRVGPNIGDSSLNRRP